MAFVVTDVEVVVALGVVLIIVYIIGSYWKHRTLTRYAHWFENNLKDRAHVQFHSFGHAGLRVKCEMQDRSTGFRELYFALSLGARENLMYYPLFMLTNDYDRVNCWGITDGPVRSKLRLNSLNDKRRTESSENEPNMRRLNIKGIEQSGYVVFASDTEAAMKFLERSNMANRLAEFQDIELVELDSMSSLIRVVSKLRREKLPDLVKFVLSLGRAV